MRYDYITPNKVSVLYELLKDNIQVSGGKIKRLNIPVSFDIETTSFTYNGEKRAIIYCWSLCFVGLSVFGRTWNEYDKTLQTIKGLFEINENKRLVIYIHNLSYEFQFMRKHYKWSKVFSLSNRKPVYAITDDGIEYRCSYLLSGYSLEVLARNLQYFDINKKVGDLDYTKLRHSKTRMTDKEIDYSIYDTKIVVAYITEQILQNNTIGQIPLTKTGYVRRYLRKECLSSPGYAKKLMRHLTITPDEYKMLKRAFQGGFTHANPFYSQTVVNDVTSYDFTSAYPAMICSGMFPMSKGELITGVNESQFRALIKKYCCIFDIKFTGLRSYNFNDSPLSVSRCYGIQNVTENNGRVVNADIVMTTITEQDFLIFEQFYKWDKMEIGRLYKYERGYLPKPLIKAVLNLYAKKTELKGIKGKDAEYLNSKEMLNSAYGCMVMDIIRDEYEYTDDWQEPITPDLNDAIEKYNNDKTRFLFYPWGVYVTALCRKALFSGIIEFNDDYVYADTDSIKVINAETHTHYIEEYNRMIINALKRVCEWYDIDPKMISPKTVKGEEKPLGVWDFDGHYKRFKTLGAKRYLIEFSGQPEKQYKLTVAGLSKKTAIKYLCNKYGDPFEGFKKGLFIPGEHTGKQTHTYIDTPFSGTLTDYNGVTAEYSELSAIHLEGASYDLSISGKYLSYLNYINGGFDIE